MVYCELIKRDGSLLTYQIGGFFNDLTGELVVDYVAGTYEITKEPENSKVYDRHIGTMLSRAQADFEKGVFKRRLSYEIG